MPEREYSYEDLEKIREQGSKLCPCYKKRDGKCRLQNAQMYDHDGGVFVEHMEELQWVYFKCSVCDYDWNIYKIIRLIETKK